MDLQLILLFLLIFCAYADDSRSFCFVKKIRNSDCTCENLLLAEHVDLDATSKLTCRNGDALQAAIEAQKSHNDLIFVQIYVTGGDFESIRHRDLKNFQTVEQLNLFKNNISFIENDAFKGPRDLKILNLASNLLSVLKDHEFRHLSKLRNLTLAENKLHSIEASAFSDLHGLIHLDLSYNNLTFIDNWFAQLKSLQTLLLCHNEISTIANNSFGSLLHLHRLDLSFNNLKVIPNLLFYRLKSLSVLSLAMNQLETLNESIFKGNNALERVNLTGNLWVCDNKMLPLNDLLKKYETKKEEAICVDPLDMRNYTIQNAMDILHLEWSIRESSICNATMCNCTISRDKLVVTVDCSHRGLARLPEALPYKTRVLNLHNNRIKSLTIDHINATLWSDVSFLYLNNNVIDSVKSLEGNWLLKNLVALHLSDNRLMEIPIHILEQIRGGLLDELYLSGNPWTCDCNTVRFQTWLQDNYRVVRNFDGICCSAASGQYSNLPIYKLKKSQLCPQQVQLVNYLDVLNGLMGVAICLILLKLSYDYWLQKRTGRNNEGGAKITPRN